MYACMHACVYACMHVCMYVSLDVVCGGRGEGCDPGWFSYVWLTRAETMPETETEAEAASTPSETVALAADAGALAHTRAQTDRLAPVVSLARLRIARHAHDNGQGAGGTRTGLSLSPAEKPETASITPGAYRCGSRRVRCRVGCEGARSSDRKREASACTPPQMPLPCTRSSLSAWAMQHRPLASESMRVRPPFRAARTR